MREKKGFDLKSITLQHQDRTNKYCPADKRRSRRLRKKRNNYTRDGLTQRKKKKKDLKSYMKKLKRNIEICKEKKEILSTERRRKEPEKNLSKIPTNLQRASIQKVRVVLSNAPKKNLRLI